MRELAETARQWAAEGRGGFLARPVAEEGFGPRDPAGAVLIDPRGECVGALYRGVFDAELVAEAGALRDGETARVCEVSVGADEAARARLTCGGAGRRSCCSRWGRCRRRGGSCSPRGSGWRW
ncbi:hypothetical protein GCM10020254_30780 [Streptomyces goshikiensis]